VVESKPKNNRENILPAVEHTLLLRLSPIDSFFRQNKDRRSVNFVGGIRIGIDSTKISKCSNVRG
jgi:hypothetical protein